MILMLDQIVSQNVWGGKVHQVPIVDAFEVFQVEFNGCFRILFIFLDEDEQGAEPAFMPFALKKGLDELV